MKILFIGDVVGKAGKETVADLLPDIKQEHEIDFVIANGVCAANDGLGVKREDVEELLSYGVDCVTSGDDVWRKKEIVEFLEQKPTSLLRPLNYPPGVPGLGSSIYKLDIAVINLLGRSFLALIDCPFRVGLSEIETLAQQTKIIIIDFHAQTTAEKQAFVRHVDGKVSAVIGTHTKVPTADEGILPGGTAFISDVGLTGAKDSIGGMKRELYINHYLTGIPTQLEAATGKGVLNAVILDIDETTGKPKSIQRLQVK